MDIEAAYKNEVFRTRLRDLRTRKKESQGDVAAVLGVTTTQISDMEKGRRTTTFEKLFLLCQHFNVSADYLLGLTNDPRPLRTDEETHRP